MPRQLVLGQGRRVLGLLVVLVVLLGGAPSRVATAATSELFFSEYIEGSSNNKALEIYNGTGAGINLLTAGYSVQVFFNGSTSAGLTINLTGSVASGDVYVLAQSSAVAAILAQADQRNGSGWFNGNDAVVLRKGTTVLDVIGQIGVDPGAEWGSGLSSTADNTLRRKNNVSAGDTNGTDAFDPAVTWDGYATDSFDGLGSHVLIPEETAPSVSSTTQTSSAINDAVDANVTIKFSEAVDVSGSSFAISCASSGDHTATISGGPTTFSLDLSTGFASNEVCTVTVIAAQVADQDSADPPDNMAADYNFNFTTAEVLVCGEPATFIHSVQGTGARSQMVGATNVIEGVVVGDYQASNEFSGFHIQEEDADADGNAATSEGIFVYDNAFGLDVQVGDKVRVQGKVTEFVTSGAPLTELAFLNSIRVCGSGNSVTPASVTLPVASLSDWERFESMRINIAQDLTVTENYTLGRFGEVSLSAGGRLSNPTNVVAPGASAKALQDLNNRSRILLDDGNGEQNIDPTLYPSGGLNASNTLRDGYTVNGLTGVLEQRFGAYRVQPVAPIDFTASNPRSLAPSSVGGTLKVASFNVLNYFNGDGEGGDFPTPRGANTAAEFSRQRDKIIGAIRTMNADVIGLMEIENDAPPSSALEDLVDGLNAAAGAGTYAFINTGIVGTDAIRVAIIFKPAAVTPVGAYAILNSSVDPNFIDTKSRPVLAQTFQQNTTGAKFTVAVNHLKSKGSDCNDLGDPDTGDGQGNCNLTRTKAAQALMTWIATDPTGSSDPDYLVIGDLNSYAKEDPITAITNAGYTNLIESFVGAGAYSYVFGGQSGYLDHALSSPGLTPQVTGVTEWHINADEPIVLDYNVEFKSSNQVNTFYDSGPYRASDHDPVIVGMNLNDAPTADGGGPYSVGEGQVVMLTATGSDPNGDPLTYTWDFDDDGQFDDATGATPTFSASGLDGPSSVEVSVQVSDPLGLTATDSATITIDNVAPSAVDDMATTQRNTSVAIFALGNDTDVSGDPISVVSFTQPTSGTVDYSKKNNNFRYTPKKGFRGVDTFTYTITDDDGAQATGTVTITVN